MTALVIAEHDNASLKGSTLNTVTAAAQAGGDVHVLVAGSNAKAAADAAAQVAGVAKVLLADAAQFADGLAENVAEQVLAIAKDYSHILAPATAYGKNILPRVAAKLDVARFPTSPRSSRRHLRAPIYAGNAIATVQSIDPIKVITVRTTGFDPAAQGGSAAVESIPAVADSGKSSFVGREVAKSDRPELTAAKIIVSGGRGMGSAKASRSWSRWPTSWAPPWVPPRRRRRGLRAQRLAGRPDRQDRRAAAVHRRRYLRRDPAPGRHEGLQGDRRHQQGREAPIFSVADYGLVGDLFEVVPELVKQLADLS
jgi:electron transfer flavoprotein alpha subunit